jgi:hypothetical protein
MCDKPDDAKREPVPFPVEVTVDGVRVTVTLMLKPGTAVTSRKQKPRQSRNPNPPLNPNLQQRCTKQIDGPLRRPLGFATSAARAMMPVE